MSERFLKWAIRRHFREKGFKVRIARIRLGNTEVDGEVEGKGWKMALEIKTPGDDLTRGLGQLAEAVAFGYKACALVTTLRKARRVDATVFDRLGLVLLGVDSKGQVHQVYPTYAAIRQSS
jgi:hypothetical protein